MSFEHIIFWANEEELLRHNWPLWKMSIQNKMNLLISFVNSIFFLSFFLTLFLVITDVPISPPFVHLYSAPAFPSLWPPPHSYLYRWVVHVYSLANPFTFFFQSPSTPSPYLFHVSMLLFLLNLSVYLFFLFSCNKTFMKNFKSVFLCKWWPAFSSARWNMAEDMYLYDCISTSLETYSKMI